MLGSDMVQEDLLHAKKFEAVPQESKEMTKT